MPPTGKAAETKKEKKMDLKGLLVDFISSFFLVLVVALVTTYVWNLLFHEAGAFDYETSFRLAIILGIVLPWIKARERKQ